MSTNANQAGKTRKSVFVIEVLVLVAMLISLFAFDHATNLTPSGMATSHTIAKNILDSQNRIVGADITFINAKTGILYTTKSVNPGTLPITAQAIYALNEVADGQYDVTINPEEGPINEIAVEGFEVSEDNSQFIRIDDVPETAAELPNVVEVYAIDPTAVTFTEATVTATAKGNALYKCKEWNFDSQSCSGSWVKLMDIVPGQQYEFTLTSDDPGFAEILVTNAKHLDENRGFISDIYGYVKVQDGNWSEPIYSNQYVRVTFEQSLTNGNVVNLVVRNSQSLNTYIEVYEKGDSTVLASTPVITSSGQYDATLAGMSGSNTIFDLKIVNQNSNSSAYLEFDYIKDAATGTSKSDLAFFLSGSSAFIGNAGGVDSDQFGETPIQVNDYGSDVSEKCGAWQCTAHGSSTSATAGKYCSGQWDCTKWNGNACGQWNCTAWSDSTARRYRYCSGVENCTSWNGTICKDWSCTAWSEYAGNDAQSWCSGQWNSTNWNGTSSSVWNCTAWTNPGVNNYRRDVYCSGVEKCTNWNSIRNNCDTWNCTTLTIPDIADALDRYCSGQWNCTEWNGNVCTGWNCTNWAAAGTATRDEYCSGQWNCTKWNGTSCSDWNCTAWTLMGTTNDDYCSGVFNCTSWQSFTYAPVVYPTIYNVNKSSSYAVAGQTVNFSASVSQTNGTVDTAWFTDNFDMVYDNTISQLTATKNYQFGKTNLIGQQFKPTKSSYAYEGCVNLSYNQGTKGNVTLGIYSVGGNGYPKKLLTSWTVNSTSVNSTATVFCRNFSKTVYLTSGVTYALALNSSNSSSNAYKVYASGSSLYSGGYLLKYGGLWNVDKRHDLYFSIKSGNFNWKTDTYIKVNASSSNVSYARIVLWAMDSAFGYNWCANNSQGSSTCKNLTINSYPDPITDTIYPTGNIVVPSNGSSLNGQVTLKGNASDDVAIAYAYMQYMNTTVDWTTFDGCDSLNSPYECTWNTSQSSNSSAGYDVQFVPCDTAGNCNATTAVNHYIIDFTIPQAASSVKYPGSQNSVRNGQTITLRVNATSTIGINRTTIDLTNLNGSANTTMVLESGSTSANQISVWNISVTLSGTTTGQKYIDYYVYDTSAPANKVYHSALSVQIDNAAPTYDNSTLGYDVSDPVYNNTNVTFSVEAFDNYNLSYYIFSSNFTGTWSNATYNFTSSLDDWAQSTNTLYAGTYGFYFTFFDEAGNLNSTTTNYIKVYGPEPTPVNITMLSPDDGTTFSASNVTFSYNYSGTAQTCGLYINDNTNLTNNSPSNSTTQSFQQNFSTDTYSWGIGCNNSYGDVFYSDSRVFTVDTTYPAISLLGPSDNVTNTNGFINFFYNTTDPDDNVNNCSLILNGTVNSTSSSVASGIQQQFTVNSLAQGNYIWKINCTDTHGNRNSSTSRTFDVKYLANATNGTIVINQTMTDSLGNPLNATITFVETGTGQTDYNTSNGQPSNISAGTYDIQIALSGSGVKAVTFFGVNVTGNITSLVNISNSSDSKFPTIYGIDPTISYNYSSANITITATMGRFLYKCTNWNSTDQSCTDGKWKKIGRITPGQNYTIVMRNSTDPGFGEFNSTLNVLDYQDYLVSSSQTILANASNIYDINVNLTDNVKVIGVNVYGYNDSALQSDLRVQDGVYVPSSYVSAYSVDTSNLSNANITVTVVASENTLYKCANWSSSAQTCLGSWTLFRTGLVLGQTYNFTLLPGDPGFAGAINTAYVLHNETDSQFASYRQMKNVSVDVASSVASGNATLTNNLITCWNASWITTNLTGRASINGTWNFNIYTNCTAAFTSNQYNLRARILKVNTSGEFNFVNSSATGFACAAGTATVKSWSFSVPNSSYTLLQAGDRAGAQICVQVTGGGANNKYGQMFWENGTPSNVVIPVSSFITSPEVHLIAPANNTLTTVSSQTFSCNITSTGIANLTLNVWNSSGTLNYTNTTILSGTTSNSTNWPFSLPKDDAYKWNCLGENTFGDTNYSLEGNYTITLDTTAPNVTLALPTPANNTMQNFNYTIINATAVDNGTYINICTLQSGGANYTMTKSGTGFSVSCFRNQTGIPDGTYSYSVYANDMANNTGVSETRNITIDTIPPTTSATAVNSSGGAYTFNSWTNSAYVNVTLSCNDGSGSGCNVTQYCTDAANTCTPSTTYTTPVQVPTENTSYIRYRSNDTVANLESIKNSTIKIDTTAPAWSGNATSPTNSVTYSPSQLYQFNITWTDLSSGLATILFEHNFTGVATNYTPAGFTGNTTSRTYFYNYTPLAVGTYYWKVYANDTLGNRNETPQFTYVVQSAPTSLAFSVNQTMYPQGRSPGAGFDIYIPFQARYLDNLTGQPISGATCNVANDETDDEVELTYNATIGNYTSQVSDYMMYDVVTFNVSCSKINYTNAVNSTSTNVWFLTYLQEWQNRSYGYYNNYSTTWMRKEAINNTIPANKIYSLNLTPGINLGAEFYHYAAGVDGSFMKMYNLLNTKTLRMNMSLTNASCAVSLCTHIEDYYLNSLIEKCGEEQTIPANTTTLVEQNITDNITLDQNDYVSLHVQLNCSSDTIEQLTVYYNYSSEPANIEMPHAQPFQIASYIIQEYQLDSGYYIGPNQTADANKLAIIQFNNSMIMPMFLEYWYKAEVKPEYPDSVIPNRAYIYNSTGQLWASDNASAGAPRNATIESDNHIRWTTESIPGNTVINETLNHAYRDAIRDTENLISDTTAQKIWNISLYDIYVEEGPRVDTYNITAWTNYSTYGAGDDWAFSVNKTQNGTTTDITNQAIVNTTAKTITMPMTNMSEAVYSVYAHETTPPEWSNNATHPTSPTMYAPNQTYQFNITWTDLLSSVSSVLFQHNFTGTLTNYSATGSNGSTYFYDYGSLTAGIYYWMSWASDTLGNLNFTTQFSYVVNQTPTTTYLYLNGVRNNAVITYPTQINVSANTSALILDLYRNGTPISSGNPTSNATTLAAGSYNYTAINGGNQNYSASSETWFLNVNRNTSTCSLSFVPGSPQIYGTNTTANCSCTNPEIAAQLYRNGTNVTSENNIPTGLPVGILSYVCNISATQNYTAATNSSLYTVGKANSTANLLLNGFDGDAAIVTNQTINITGYVTAPASGYIEVYENGTLLDYGQSPRTIVKNYSTVGTRNITVIYNETANYTSGFATHEISVTLNDTTAPSLANVSSVPMFPLLNNGSNQTISVDFSSNEYPVNVTFGVYSVTNGTLMSNTIVSVTNSSQLPINYTLPSLPDGNYTINMSVSDTIGNSNTTNLGTVLIDTSVPALSNTITYPTLPLSVTNGNQTLSVNFTTTEFPINVTFNVYAANGTLVSTTTITVTNVSQLPVNYSIPTLPNGDYTINMSVLDTVGNTNTTVLGNVTVTLFADGSACTIGSQCSSGSCINGICASIQSCGDGVCNGAETCYSCVPDCGLCRTGGGGGAPAVSTTPAPPLVAPPIESKVSTQHIESGHAISSVFAPFGTTAKLDLSATQSSVIDMTLIPFADITDGYIVYTDLTSKGVADGLSLTSTHDGVVTVAAEGYTEPTKFDAKDIQIPESIYPLKDGEVLYQAFNLYHVGLTNNVKEVIFRLRVNRSWVTINRIDPETVVLHRQAVPNGSWQALPTYLTGNGGTYYEYLSISPGLSTFALVATSPPLLCSVCERGVWSQCVDGEQTRLTNECGPQTAYACKPTVEKRACERPAPPSAPQALPLDIIIVPVIGLAVGSYVIFGKRRW